MAAEDGRAQFARQEEDDDDGTLNPNTLPQVAQILGAIFAGNLNLTSIVDKTFGLVPDALRNQVDGLFKILTGQSAATTTTTTPKPAKKPVKRNSTKTTKKNQQQKTIVIYSRKRIQPLLKRQKLSHLLKIQFQRQSQKRQLKLRSI